jgi:pilus assembly protein CpaC
MSKRLVSFYLILLAVTGVPSYAQVRRQSDQTRPRVTQLQMAAADGVSQVRLQPTEEQPATMRVSVGRSLVVNSALVLKRVSISDPNVATAVIISPTQVLINGLAPGRVTLLLWDERERPTSVELQVEIDLTGLRDAIAQVYPKENIQISQVGGSIMLTGTASSKEVVDQLVVLAQTHGKNVVNLVGLIQEPGKEVLLQVRFAEVDRVAVQQLGINIISTGATNTPGSVTTGQFGPPRVSGEIRGAIPPQLEGTQTSFALSDLLNIFVFRPDLNLATTIRALQQNNVLQILAEPNLLALNGKEASFLAGGEFPFPVVQGGTNFTAVTIQFREFGVRLKFTPNILPDGTIRLKVAPEVSSLDFSNALTISGFVVPALTTRKAETEVELKDGQSFAIAGLIDNRLTEVSSKIPGLGDIPIIGKLFRSRSQNRSNTELLVMVTPKLVRPLSPGQVPPLPPFPRPFIDRDKFDGKAGEAPPRRKN